MSYDSNAAQTTRSGGSAHGPVVLALLAVVIVVDQLGKYWAWRHAPLAKINYAGNIFVGDTISQWYAEPTSGALLDLMDFGLLSAAVFVLIRRRSPAVVLVPGGLMVGGWISNLLDRLGLHYLTAQPRRCRRIRRCELRRCDHAELLHQRGHHPMTMQPCTAPDPRQKSALR